MLHVIDIETDSLDPNTINLVVVKPLGSKAYRVCTIGLGLRDYIEENRVTGWIGHNISRFDAPALKKLWGVTLEGKLYDTLLLSKLLDRDRAGGHSLQALGTHIGWPKDEIDFDKADFLELKKYCKRDVDVTEAVFNYLVKKASVISDASKTREAYSLELEVAVLMDKQVTHGVYFNKNDAYDLHTKVCARMGEITTLLEKDIPRIKLPKSKLKYPPKKQFKKDGTPSASMRRYCNNSGFRISTSKKALRHWSAKGPDGEVLSLPLTEPLVTTEPLNLNNQAGLKDYLLSEGWEPTIWNYKKDMAGKPLYPRVTTSPKLYDENKVVCPNLALMTGINVPLISEYLTLRSRGNVLYSPKGTGWLLDRRVVKESVISADADTLGCNTHRMSHKKVANVPTVDTPYGLEMRSLFIPRDGLVMVGWDASGLEARIEAHYTFAFDRDYAKSLVTGAIHSENAQWMKEIVPEVGIRKAKELKYAMTYGASPPRVKSILGCNLTQAKLLYGMFWAKSSPLASLKQALERQWEHTGKTYIIAIDGRRIPTRSRHSLLNALFQSGGAIIMKRAMVIMEEYKDWNAFGCHGLIRYHDEEQWEAPKELAKLLGTCGISSIQQAGEYYDLNVELTGEYKVGESWGETH